MDNNDIPIYPETIHTFKKHFRMLKKKSKGNQQKDQQSDDEEIKQAIQTQTKNLIQSIKRQKTKLQKHKTIKKTNPKIISAESGN